MRFARPVRARHARTCSVLDPRARDVTNFTDSCTVPGRSCNHSEETAMTTQFDYEISYRFSDHAATYRGVIAAWTVIGFIFLGLLAV